MKNLNFLNTYGMITMDDETIDVKPAGMSKDFSIIHKL
jgi:hypothetical protein